MPLKFLVLIFVLILQLLVVVIGDSITLVCVAFKSLDRRVDAVFNADNFFFTLFPFFISIDVIVSM